MYRVKNISKGKVIIGDLNLVLKHGEETDLDTQYPRAMIEKSQNLHYCIKHRFVSEPIDDRKPADALPLQSQFIIIPSSSPSQQIDSAMLSDLENRLRDHIIKEISSIKTGDTSEMSIKLDMLLQAVSRSQLNRQIVEETDTCIDDDKMVDIHARTIERISRNAESHVAPKQEIKISNVNQRADELENLL